jgi:hypothetical protein
MDKEEWNTLDALRRELNANLMAFDSYAQEKFSKLFVESIEGKSDRPPITPL